ncbi:MAG: type II secretion system F family protein [Piscirickettsiaceae bacterium]|nr:type II secretion system F family protein [Piscirickettsiaceae bacterium]
MRYFYYKRLLDTGQVQSGFTKLAFFNDVSARYYLEQRYSAIILNLLMLPTWFNPILDLFEGFRHTPITREELADFLRNLAVMQRSGIPIFDAMEELTSDDSTAQSRKLAEDILESLKSGSTLSNGFLRHKDIIPETVQHLIQIGESSGTLERTLMDASSHLNRLGKIIRDTKRAMIYPVFVFLSIIGAAAFWVGYVIPSISDLFKQMKVELPPLTRWVLDFSENFTTNITIFIVVSIIFIITAVISIKKSQRVRYKWHLLLMKLPISRTLTRSSSLAFITEYMSLLVSSGLTMLNSLTILERATKNEVYKQTITQMKEGIMKGNSLSSEMRKTNIYPGFAIRMISVGEQTGNLDEQLAYLAEEYRQRFDNLVSSIAEILKPLVMLFAGGLFILMIVALFLPIYQLIGQVGGA